MCIRDRTHCSHSDKHLLNTRRFFSRAIKFLNVVRIDKKLHRLSYFCLLYTSSIWSGVASSTPKPILCAMVSVNSVSIHSVRNACAYVPQDNFLFSDTIAHNIGFGVEDATPDQCRDIRIFGNPSFCTHYRLIYLCDILFLFVYLISRRA